jgi:hypothetical protein
MALLRCGKCGFLREVPNQHIGKKVRCPECKESSPIWDTAFFVSKLLERYREQGRQLKACQENGTTGQAPAGASAGGAQTAEPLLLDEIEINNTTALTQEEQYAPIIDWLKGKQIDAQVNPDAIDTTGFFDEIACMLGENYQPLYELYDKIKYVQNKGYVDVKQELADKSQQEAQLMRRFCEDLYEYSFVGKYFYQKKDKIIRLKLQTAQPVMRFFNGEWLEWFVFIKGLEFFREQNIPVSSLRSLKVTFPDESNNELDTFFLANGKTPLCVECKTGEFRQEIDKYLKLRKRLKLAPERFVLCIAGLGDDHAKGLSGMYDLTFTNESNLVEHLKKLEW